MPEIKYVAGKEGIQELWRRVKTEIGKFTAFQPADPAPDGTPDIALADRKTNIIYLVPVNNTPAPDHYREWIWTTPESADPGWVCIGDTSIDLSGYALKSEMSVTPGTGADADKTTITLKAGTSAIVLTAHQDLGDYVSVNQQSFTSEQKETARANIGAAEDTAVQTVMIGAGQASKSGTTVTIPMAATGVDGAMSGEDKDKLDGIAQGAQVNVQADWNQDDSSKDDYIKNKPDMANYYTKQEADAAFMDANTVIPAADGTTITDTSGTLSVAVPVPSASSASTGDVLTKTSNGIGWQAIGVFNGNSAGLVPSATAADADKALRGDGTWGDVSNARISYNSTTKELSLDFSPQSNDNNGGN